MGKPFSLRLGETTLERLAQRAARGHEAPRTLAQRYVEEGLRHDEHPLIHFVEGPAGRRAALLGAGLDVWEVVATIKDNDGDVAEAARYLRQPEHVVRAAVLYYGAFPEEVEEWIAGNERAAAEAHAAWLAGQRALAR